jgi:hypothetical protein
VRILFFILYACFINGVQAAIVTYSDGVSTGVSNSIINTHEYGSIEYNNFVSDYGIHSSIDNGGHELIFLSSQNNHHHHHEAKTLEVNLVNTNGTSQNTEDVSLVLSGGAPIIWDISSDRSVSLKNIFLFGLSTQAVNLNGSKAEFINSQSEYIDDVGLFHSSVVVCGTSLPQDGYQATCTTDVLVGINSFQELFPGVSLQTNPNSIVNYLDDLVKEYTGGSLGITNFNGVESVDSYNVEISTTAVPLPAGWILFSSALAFLVVRRGVFD